MKKIWFLIVSLSFAFISFSQTTRQLKKILELKITGEGGSNGASVVWHPVQKKYYAVMAGNANFPMNVYDVKGVRLSTGSQTALFDVRGFWYNSITKTLQANGYNDYGWTEYKLDSRGMPVDVNSLADDMHQPDENSAGSFDAKTKKVYFLNSEGSVEIYSYPDAEYEELFDLRLSLTQNDDDGSVHNEDVIDNYNYTTVIHTGIKNAEFALLNYMGKQIELYSADNGYMTQKLLLPDNAPVEERLNFAYTNGIYWLFDRTERKWIGYR